MNGEYDHIPVIRLDCLGGNTIVIVDFERFATLVQLAPDDGKQFPLAMSVTEITAEEAEVQLNRETQQTQQKEATDAQRAID